MPYKWKTPHDWLADKAKTDNLAELSYIIDSLSWRLDNDAIQDLFQSQMAEDGYFDERND
jgi:hypothetical protein